MKFHVSATLEDAFKNERNLPATLSLLYTRMGLMKAYHLRNSPKEGGKQMSSDLNCYLNEEHPHPAYHSGRLMAVFADLQHSALGDVGAGVVQRYYAAASATPALVLGRLARTSQFHLNKLDPGLAHWYENKIAGIWCRIKDAVPSALNLEEQSLFALGYYQQIASRRPDKSTGLTDEKNEEENRE
jgi:CRISPR-associated protein Csd1